MKKIIVSLFVLALSVSFLHAQNDTMYVMKAGVVVGKYQVNTQVDSVIFYKPVITPRINIITVQIPAGTFTMGSPVTEPTRATEEVQHQVTLSAFLMSKYEITNSQYATFLNTKGIGSNGIYAGGAYPGKTLISPSGGGSDFSLHYSGSQWVPVAGYENHPVFNVSWYGAVEFATYVGGRLPTEAEWEYACRATTTASIPFNTGSCLSNTDANYDWSYPFNTCKNTVTTPLSKTQSVGTYPANAYGLHDMHGNVWEWCSDWHGAYPTTAQTNPGGPATGSNRVERGGSWMDMGLYARSARRSAAAENGGSSNRGIRVVFNK